MTDFDGIPGQLEMWSTRVSAWFDEAIERQAKRLAGQPCQYYNQLTVEQPVGAVFVQPVVWNGFPGTLRRRYGRAQALLVADEPLPLNQMMDVPGEWLVGGQWAGLRYRPQDEYCEWRVKRDAEGRILSVTFTSEPPEYWQALHGDELGSVDPKTGELIKSMKFPGDPTRLVELYREFVDAAIELEDLVCPVDLVDDGKVVYRKGEYNPYNRWNTTHGIMHLTHPANSLSAEIILGGDASVLRTSGGRTVADPDRLIACAGYGGENRCSDPTIGGSVNQLAALGYDVTLADPVGLYMDHLDMAGWTIGPNDEPIDSSWFRMLRGEPGYIERAVFEVPPDVGRTVSDIKIAGESIRFGGQLAERITVKLVAVAAIQAGRTTTPSSFTRRAQALDSNRSMVSSVGASEPVSLGQIPIFDYDEAITSARAFDPAPPAPDVTLRTRPFGRRSE
jgi:hypothetical protein